MGEEDIIAKLYARENYINNLKDKFYNAPNLKNNIGIIGAFNEEIKFLEKLLFDYQNSRSKDQKNENI